MEGNNPADAEFSYSELFNKYGHLTCKLTSTKEKKRAWQQLSMIFNSVTSSCGMHHQSDFNLPQLYMSCSCISSNAVATNNNDIHQTRYSPVSRQGYQFYQKSCIFLANASIYPYLHLFPELNKTSHECLVEPLAPLDMTIVWPARV